MLLFPLPAALAFPRHEGVVTVLGPSPTAFFQVGHPAAGIIVGDTGESRFRTRGGALALWPPRVCGRVHFLVLWPRSSTLLLLDDCCCCCCCFFVAGAPTALQTPPFVSCNLVSRIFLAAVAASGLASFFNLVISADRPGGGYPFCFNSVNFLVASSQGRFRETAAGPSFHNPQAVAAFCPLLSFVPIGVGADCCCCCCCCCYNSVLGTDWPRSAARALFGIFTGMYCKNV
jgi:hypothetical protein